MIDIERIQVGFRRKDYGGREASTFWRDSDFGWNQDDSAGGGHNHTKLAATQRAIGNFVNIVTGKQIPVIFKGQESYTNGEYVVIGTKLEGDKFDPTVGLALHEASHITLTDFNILKNIEKNIRLQGLDPEMNMPYEKVMIIKNILNWVEDRRIDYYSYKTAPGYRMYYEAMYDTYFNAGIIDKALKEKVKCEETWDDYLFHIINFTNPNRNLDTLKVLRQVWDVIRLNDIGRLKSTRDAFVLSCEIFKIIETHLKLEEAIQQQKKFLDGDIEKENAEPTQKDKSNCNQAEDYDDDDGTDADGEDSFDTNPDGNDKGVDAPGNNNGNGGDDSDDTDNDPGKAGGGDNGYGAGAPDMGSNESTPEPPPRLSPRQQKQLQKAIKQQNDFLKGNLKKEGRAVSKADNKMLKTIRESGTEIVVVNTNLTFTDRPKECLVVRKMTRSVMESMPRMFVNPDFERDDAQKVILAGIRLGKQLGKKLQIRNEDRTLKQTRLDSGKIDRRLVAQLGAGVETVFHRIVHDEYKNFFIHISIDASGSMGSLRPGNKLGDAIKSAVAIAQAASMTKGIRVQISLRGTMTFGDNNSGPATVYAYDSKTDKMNKIVQLFRYLNSFGATPEGVALKSIEKYMLQDAKNEECIFINYSDGMPSGYCENPLEYTGKVIKRFREQGMQVLSYFVATSQWERTETNLRNFRTMYGDDAEFIDPTKLADIARTLNKKFLERKV